MNQYEANKAIYQRWMAVWPGASGNIPYVFDNDVRDEDDIYARVSILDGDSNPKTMGAAGNRRIERAGVVEVELRGPGNVGRKQLDELTAAVRTVFEYQRIGVSGSDQQGVVLLSSSADVDPTPGDYWILVITTPFTYDELR